MAGTPGNIVVGAPATFKIAAYITAKAVSLTYTDVGYTDGGVTFDPKTELHLVKVDQALGNLAALPKDRDLEIKVKFAESNLANLQYALAQPTGNLSGTAGLYFDASAPEVYYQLQVAGRGAAAGVGTTRTMTVWKAYVKDMGSLMFKKDASQQEDLTFGVCEELTGSTTATFMRFIDS